MKEYFYLDEVDVYSKGEDQAASEPTMSEKESDEEKVIRLDGIVHEPTDDYYEYYTYYYPTVSPYPTPSIAPTILPLSKPDAISPTISPFSKLETFVKPQTEATTIKKEYFYLDEVDVHSKGEEDQPTSEPTIVKKEADEEKVIRLDDIVHEPIEYYDEDYYYYYPTGSPYPTSSSTSTTSSFSTSSSIPTISTFPTSTRKPSISPYPTTSAPSPRPNYYYDDYDYDYDFTDYYALTENNDDHSNHGDTGSSHILSTKPTSAPSTKETTSPSIDTKPRPHDTDITYGYGRVWIRFCQNYVYTHPLKNTSDTTIEFQFVVGSNISATSFMDTLAENLLNFVAKQILTCESSNESLSNANHRFVKEEEGKSIFAVAYPPDEILKKVGKCRSEEKSTVKNCDVIRGKLIITSTISSVKSAQLEAKQSIKKVFNENKLVSTSPDIAYCQFISSHVSDNMVQKIGNSDNENKATNVSGMAIFGSVVVFMFLSTIFAIHRRRIRHFRTSYEGNIREPELEYHVEEGKLVPFHKANSPESREHDCFSTNGNMGVEELEKQPSFRKQKQSSRTVSSAKYIGVNQDAIGDRGYDFMQTEKGTNSDTSMNKTSEEKQPSFRKQKRPSRTVSARRYTSVDQDVIDDQSYDLMQMENETNVDDAMPRTPEQRKSTISNRHSKQEISYESDEVTVQSSWRSTYPDRREPKAIQNNVSQERKTRTPSRRSQERWRNRMYVGNSATAEITELRSLSPRKSLRHRQQIREGGEEEYYQRRRYSRSESPNKSSRREESLILQNHEDSLLVSLGLQQNNSYPYE